MVVYKSFQTFAVITFVVIVLAIITVAITVLAEIESAFVILFTTTLPSKTSSVTTMFLIIKPLAIKLPDALTSPIRTTLPVKSVFLLLQIYRQY